MTTLCSTRVIDVEGFLQVLCCCENPQGVFFCQVAMRRRWSCWKRSSSKSCVCTSERCPTWSVRAALTSANSWKVLQQPLISASLTVKVFNGLILIRGWWNWDLPLIIVFAVSILKCFQSSGIVSEKGMKEEVPPILQYQILQLALELPASKFSWFRVQVRTQYLLACGVLLVLLKSFDEDNCCYL